MTRGGVDRAVVRSENLEMAIRNVVGIICPTDKICRGRCPPPRPPGPFDLDTPVRVVQHKEAYCRWRPL
jgi:hypothetical protein